MWLEYHSEVLQFICKLCQVCHRCRWVGGSFQADKLVLEFVRIVQVTQPGDGKCQFPHCIHQMNHYLIQAKCGLMAQDPGKLSLGEKGHLQYHSFYILLSWCGFRGYIPKVFSRAFRGDCLQNVTCVCCSGCAGYRRQNLLTR